MLPEVSPRMRFEIRRKAIHVAGAIVAVPALAFFPILWGFLIAAAAVAAITAVHFARKRRVRVENPLMAAVHDPIAKALDETRRPGEDYPWAPVTFAIALVSVGLATSFLNLPKAMSYAAFGILGMGDAASALIGIAYGKTKLPWNRKKSWEGTLAGAIAGFVAAVVLANVDFSLAGVVFPPAWFAIALVGAIVGALVESVPDVQDNLAVPIAAFAAMLVAAKAFGVA